MVNKKAQMKIQQMAFMLVAVTLFFILVGMVILVVYLSSLRETSNILENEKAMRLASKIANSPEFSCGEAFGAKVRCVDLDKVMVLKQNVELYRNFWGVDNIMIIKIYPNEFDGVDCTSENYPNCGQIRLSDSDISSEYTNYITLCRKETKDGEIYNKCELARILIDPREVDE